MQNYKPKGGSRIRMGWRWKNIQEQVAGVVASAVGDILTAAERDAVSIFIMNGLKEILEKDKMARKTYGIEAKIDFDDESRHEHALKLIKKTAKTLLTQLNLLADGRTPKVIIRTEDLFEGVEDIPLEDADPAQQS